MSPRIRKGNVMKKLVLALVLGAGVFLSPVAAKADRFIFTFAQSRPMSYPHAVVYYPVRSQPGMYWNGYYNRHYNVHYNRHHHPVKLKQKKEQCHDGSKGHHGHSRRGR